MFRCKILCGKKKCNAILNKIIIPVYAKYRDSLPYVAYSSISKWLRWPIKSKKEEVFTLFLWLSPDSIGCSWKKNVSIRQLFYEKKVHQPTITYMMQITFHFYEISPFW